ncbi:TonB-dependent receptor domain-containing protein [Sphingopyxis panaciterrae]
MPLFRLAFHGSIATAALAASALSVPALAQERSYRFSIPAQELKTSLRALARTSGQQISFDSVALQGKRAPALTGTLTVRDAVARLLAGSGLEPSWGRSGVLVVRPAPKATGAAYQAPARRPAAAPSDTADGDDGEIVVTARKSNERIQDVPVSLTAVSADTLRDRGAADIKDVLRSVPGLANFGTERGLSRYSIRGLSTYASSPTVGIYLDDISLVTVSTTFSGAYDPMFFDMERVEVLKGPQGTLYGGSAMGGAIKYVSARPDPTRFSVDTAVGAAITDGGGPSYNGEVVVNAPIVEDKLAVRAGFYYRHDGGYVDNRPGDVSVILKSSTAFPDYTPLVQDSLSMRTKKNRNYGDTYVGRLSLEWRPDDSWTIRPQLFYQDYKQGDTGDMFLGRPDMSASYRIAQPNYDRAGIYSLSVEKELGGVKLTSLTAYFDRKFRYVRDYSFYIGGLVADTYPLISTNISDSRTQTFSQELRLASDNDSPFKWVIGGYYSSQDDRLVQAVNTPGMAAVFGTDLAYFGNIFTNTKQYALFGEAGYTLFDGFDVTAGVRAFKVEQLVNARTDGVFAGGPNALADRRNKEDGINPKFGLSYKVTRDNLLYASAAKGFRPGGINRDRIDPDLCRVDLDQLGIDNAPDSFGSDNLWTYEAGTKNMFGGGKVMLNASGYYTRWKQIQQAIGLPSCGFGFTDNIGSAEVKGFELEARVEPLRGFQIGGTAAYTKSKVTEAAPGTSAKKGDALPDVPKWMATAYAGYRTEFANGWEFDARGEYQYQGSAPYSFDTELPVTYPDDPAAVTYIPNPIRSRKSYQVVNAFASLSRDNTTVRLYANNLFNVRPQLDVDLTTGSDRFSTIRPRTIGVELRQGF